MHSIVLRLLLASLIGAACVSHAQVVYAIGWHRGPMVTLRVDEHRWLVGSWPDGSGYGLLQFRSRNGEGAAWVRFTTIYLGSRQFTVRLPAMLVVGFGLMAASSVALLVIEAGSRIRKLRCT